MAVDIEVHIDLEGVVRRVGTLYAPDRGRAPIAFEYHATWLEDPARFSLEPALALDRGAFAPGHGLTLFGSIGDSAPDTWGRRLMQRRERRSAQREGRAVRTLGELDYLLGVSDIARLGALRFRNAADGSRRRSRVVYRGIWSLADCWRSPSGSRVMKIATRICGSSSRRDRHWAARAPRRP